MLCVLLLRIEMGQAVRYCVCLDKVWDVRMACLDMSIYAYLDSLQWIHLFTPEKAFHRTHEVLSMSPSVEPSSSQTPPVCVLSMWCSLSGIDSHGSSMQLQPPWGASTCSVWGPTGSAGESLLQCLEHLLLLLHWPLYQQNCFSHTFSLLLPVAIEQGLNTLSQRCCRWHWWTWPWPAMGVGSVTHDRLLTKPHLYPLLPALPHKLNTKSKK